MSEPPRAVSGLRVLRRYLAAQAPDPVALDPARFRAWLLGRMERQAEHDPLFVARCALRDRLRVHRDVLGARYEARDRAERALAESGGAERLAKLDDARFGAQRALAGLDAALASAGDDRRDAWVAKRAAFAARLDELERARRAELSDPLHQALSIAATLVHDLEGALQILDARDAVEDAIAATGARANRSGRSFERVARAVVDQHIVRVVTRAPREVRVLSGVKLGVSRAELDFVVVRGERPVEVLAVVEAKADPSDIGHGYALRQENLAFFTGLGSWPIDQYRTAVFRHGRFDVDVIHEEDGAAYQFSHSSFRRFRPIRGRFLDRLFFVCRDRPLRGVSSGLLGRLLYRVSTDPDLDLHDPAQLQGLQQWLAQASDEPNAAAVLAEYAATPRLARRVWWVR